MKIEKIKLLRKKLNSNSVSIGTWQQIPNSSISEILGYSGYDWVAIDMEHGSISIDQLPDLFRAIELGGSLPFTRLLKPEASYCKQALDAGSAGIIVPMIESSEQLEYIIDASSWPPAGNRGVGFSRANLFGGFFDEYLELAQSPFVVAQIESVNAFNNLENILQVKGLDAIMVGPYDLSASMGITADFSNKKFVNKMKEIIRLSNKYNIPCGDHVVNPDKKLLKKRIEQGYSFLAFSTDAVFLNKFSINPIR